MFEVLLPESHVRQKSTRAAVGAFLAHVCVITAAVSRTAPAPVPVMLERRDTFLLRMSDVPVTPRLGESAYDIPDLPPPPATDFHARPELPSLSLQTGELAYPGSARATIAPASRVRLDSSPTISNPLEVTGRTESPELIGDLQPGYPMELRRAVVREWFVSSMWWNWMGEWIHHRCACCTPLIPASCSPHCRRCARLVSNRHSTTANQSQSRFSR